MDRRLKVELFEVIRRGYAAGETIQGLSRKHGVHRRMVRQALGNAIPPERKAVIREREHLSQLAEEGFPIHESLYPLLVDGKGRVKVKTNWYSTPLWPGLRASAVVGPLTVEIMHDNKVTARHPRCYGRGHEILDLEHYLDVLERKPGAMKGSTPLEQWRRAGRWPACLDAIWQQLEQRHGKGKGTREMIALVRAGSTDGWDKLIVAVEEALRLGISDSAAVIHLLRMPDPEQRRQHAVALAEELMQFERPMPVMDNYDLLLANTTGAIH